MGIGFWHYCNKKTGILWIFLVLIASSLTSLIASQMATTDDGKRIRINDDGTWEYVEKKEAHSGNITMITETIVRVATFPERYKGKIVVFDKVIFGGGRIREDNSLGTVLYGMGIISTIVKNGQVYSRGEYYTPVVSRKEINFIVSPYLAGKIIDKVDEGIEFYVRLICQIDKFYPAGYRADRDYWYGLAVVRQIDFYRRPNISGKVLMPPHSPSTISESIKEISPLKLPAIIKK